MGKVYLVGAGPGDEKLITVKGLEKLKECDAVVYDRLASEKLLDYVREDCEKIYVGKQAGKHYRKQEEINEILAECGRKYNKVVRLKGGDSFVFGRGGEEIETLEKYHIPYEVIPGITSAIAVPECAGIPVTHRAVSRSFHVITGHTNTSQGSPAYDYETLAKLEGTLVFLMGLSNLGQIAEKLMEAGKKETTPVAVIANGTTDRQQTVTGTLLSIAEEVKRSSIPSPAVIVIGDTAAYSYCDDTFPVRRIGVTATKVLQEKLKRGFEEIGMQTVPVCNMELQKTQQMERLRQELQHIEEYQWVVFTSQNAVILFFEELKKEQIDVRKLGQVKFAVLGSGTADKLKEYGLIADFVPSRYQVSVLAEEFVQVVKEQERVLIPRAVQGSPELTRVLAEHQVAFCDLAVYDVAGCLCACMEDFENLDYLIFVSASGVQAFFQEIQEKEFSLPKEVKIACIGKVTCKKLKEMYGQADIVAEVNDVEGLLEAVVKYENDYQ